MNDILLILIGLSVVVIGLLTCNYAKKHTKNLMSDIQFETFKDLEQKIQKHAQSR